MNPSGAWARKPVRVRVLGLSSDGYLVTGTGSNVAIRTDERHRISLSAGATMTVEEARELADVIAHVANEVAGGWDFPERAYV